MLIIKTDYKCAGCGQAYKCASPMCALLLHTHRKKPQIPWDKGLGVWGEGGGGGPKTGWGGEGWWVGGVRAGGGAARGGGHRTVWDRQRLW